MRFSFMTAPFIAAAALSILPMAPAAAQGPGRPALARPTALDTSLGEAIKSRIEEEIENQDLVGLSAGVVIDSQVVATLHFGWQDRGKEIPASDDTMYRWASISKPLTALVAMQLAEEGALDLDLDVRQYVPEFPEKPWPITARQLLCHQGGVVHYSNGEVVRRTREYDVENPYESVILALDRFCESPLVCEPGTKYSYTTHGYMLLGAVVERAGGASFADLVKERIAERCGMTSLQPDYQWLEIENRAVGYRKVGPAVMESTDTDVSWKLAGGGWISTVGDLARLAAALTTDDLGEASLLEAMWTPQPTRDGARTSYGLGFQVGSLEGERTVGHSGSQEKTRTQMLICPDRKCAVVIMCNTEHAQLGRLARDLLKLLIEQGGAEDAETSEDDSSDLRRAA